ncbi:MAG: DUF1800 domain-containing protein [Betaproteobacteria bacterium]
MGHNPASPMMRFAPPLLRSTVVALSFASALVQPVLAATGPVLGYDDARHLLARTGFGPTDAEVRVYAALTRDAAVAKLLLDTSTVAFTKPPASATDADSLPPPRGENATEAERKAFVQQQIREGLELRAWWVEEMVTTKSPLTERMTLFWHNHFVSGQPKVRLSRLMYQQNATLRAHALGNFGMLLHAVAKDPAMLVYLDGVRNRKGAPNENFAREVMELFTLGEGNYTEKDIKEAARAFTGWSVDRATGQYLFRPALHDYGVKTVLGKSGRFDGDDVLDLLLARPETAQYVTSKLWREFVSPDVDPMEVRRIAARFRDSSYDIRVVLCEILTSKAFYASENRGTLVKSPVELIVGTVRVFDLRPDRTLPFAYAAAGMGQNLLAPPNVKGWPGGETWINTTTLLSRKQFVDRLTRADDTPAPTASAMADGNADAVRRQRFIRQMDRGLSGVHFDSDPWMTRFPGETPVERARWAQRLLLPVEPQQATDLSADSLAVVRGLVLDAAYQLK